MKFVNELLDDEIFYCDVCGEEIEEETNTDYIVEEEGIIKDHTFTCKNCGAEYLVKAEYTLRRTVFLKRKEKQLHG